MVYGMAIYRVLPPVLSSVNRRFSTPVVASVVIGVILIAAPGSPPSSTTGAGSSATRGTR
jgi:amino acid transporter